MPLVVMYGSPMCESSLNADIAARNHFVAGQRVATHVLPCSQCSFNCRPILLVNVQVRRNSTEAEELFIARISAMDSLARGLRNASRII
jgi:hypothetical protein